MRLAVIAVIAALALACAVGIEGRIDVGDPHHHPTPCPEPVQ